MESLVFIFSCKICSRDSGYKSFLGLCFLDIASQSAGFPLFTVSWGKDETIEHSQVALPGIFLFFIFL